MSWSYTQNMAGADNALKNMVSNARASQDLVGGRAQELFNQYDAAKKKIKDKFDKYSSMAENVGKQLEGVAGTMEGGAFTSHHLAPGLRAMGSGGGDVEGGLKALAGRIRGRVAGRQLQGYADRIQVPEGRAADATNALYRQQDREASTAIQRVVRGRIARVTPEERVARDAAVLDRRTSSATSAARDAADAAQRSANVATDQPYEAAMQLGRQVAARGTGSSVARSAANDAATAADSADRSIRGAVGNAAGSAARGAAEGASSYAQEAQEAVRGAVVRSGSEAARGAASGAQSAAQEAEEAVGRAATNLNRSSIKRFQSLDTAKYQGSSSAREASEAASGSAADADRAVTAARSQQWLEKSPGAATTIGRRARGMLGRAVAERVEGSQDLAAVQTQGRAMRSPAYRVAEDDPIRVGGAGREPAARTLQRVRRGQVGREAADTRADVQTAGDVQTQARSYAQLRPSEDQQESIDLYRRFSARDVDFQRLEQNYRGNNAVSAARGARASAQGTSDAMDTLGPELDTMRSTQGRAASTITRAVRGRGAQIGAEREDAVSTMQRGVRRLAGARTSDAQQVGSSAASDAASAAQRAADSAESDANAIKSIQDARADFAGQVVENPMHAATRGIGGGDVQAGDSQFYRAPPSMGARIAGRFQDMKETLGQHLSGGKQYVAAAREGAQGGPRVGTFQGADTGLDYDTAGIPLRSVGRGAQAISRAARTSASAAADVGDTATDIAATSAADVAGGVGDALEMAGAALDATGVGAALGIGLGLVGAAVGIGGAAAEVVGDIRDEVALHTDIGNKVTQMAFSHGAGMSGGAMNAAVSTSRGVTQNMHGGF